MPDKTLSIQTDFLGEWLLRNPKADNISTELVHPTDLRGQLSQIGD